MTTPFTIRSAEVRDIEALVQLRLELLHVAAALDAPTNLTEAEWKQVGNAIRDYFSGALPDGKHCGVVAEVEGKVIACGGLVFFERPPYQGNLAGLEAYLMNMYTLPEWRGKGAGTAILAELLKQARQAGVKRISLDAETKARRLYEAAGFHGNAEAMEIWL
jgi:GNAT superfamily N-acetyltransferase